MEILFDAELFGHAKDAFMAAVRENQGLLEMTCKGTAFLDETGGKSRRQIYWLLEKEGMGDCIRKNCFF